MKINNIIIAIIIGIIGVLIIYPLFFNNNSHSSSPQTSNFSETPNFRPNNLPSETEKKINSLLKQMEQKEQIKQNRDQKILQLNNKMGFDKDLNANIEKVVTKTAIMHKKSELNMQIKDITIREIPQANNAIEFNQSKIATHDAKKRYLQEEPRTSENLTKIDQLDQEIKTLNTDIQNIKATIAEREQQTLPQLEAALQKLTTYEAELKAIEAEYQQQIKDLENPDQ